MINNCPQIKLNNDVVEFVSKFNTSEQLLRSGGLPTEMLDRLAYGFSEEDIQTLKPEQLSIKWQIDYDNVKWEQINSGLNKTDWAKQIHLDEPIDVVYERGKFYIDDGHHRYYAAKILGKPLNVNLIIKDNPITKISPELDYDTFHRCLFKQVKNI